MNLNESNIRAVIRQIIAENFQELDEAKKGNQFDMYLELAFNSAVPDVPEGKFNGIDIKKQALSILETKLSKIFQKDFEYADFHIVKLGKFVVKSNEGKETLSFIKNGDMEKKYSYTYLYIYHNTIELIRFGSEFFETDAILLKSAQEYIINRKINLVTKTETGHLKIENGFEYDNVIDLTDYNQVQRPAAIDTKRHGAPYVPKSSYKVGQKVAHRDYGIGLITAVKKIPSQVPTYDVTANYKQGDRLVSKTIRMNTKMKGQTS